MATSGDRIQRAVNQFPDISVRAAVIAEWIQRRLTLSQNLAGQIGAPFILAPFQLDLLNEAYPGMPFEDRTINRIFFSVARKNGKTELLAAMSLVHLIGPESVPSAMVINAAGASESQAALTLEKSRMMVARSSFLSKRIKYVNSRLIYENGSDLRVQHTVSTKTQGVQGKHPTFFTLDEHSETTDRDIYESLHNAQTTINAMGWLASTRSLDPTSLFCQLDTEIENGQKMGTEFDHWYKKIYSADINSEDLFTEENTLAANPGVGYTISYESLMQSLAVARASIGARPNFRARKLNIETGNSASLVDPQMWKDAGQAMIDRDELWELMRGQQVRIGADVGNTLSMTALAFYWPQSRFVSVVNFMPRHCVSQMETLHKANYGEFAEAGRLILLDTDDRIGYDYGTIADWIVKAYEYFDVRSFRYDGWHFGRVLSSLVDRGMHKDHHPLAETMTPFIQGAKTYGTAICEFEDLIVAKLLKHDNDPVTNISVLGCLVASDHTATKENRKIAKNKNALPNDAACAMIMAVANMEDDIADNPASIEELTTIFDDIEDEDEDDMTEEDEELLAI